MLDEEAGNLELFAEWAQAFGHGMADEVFENEDEIHALVLHALFERLERRRPAAFVRLPLKFVKLEGLLERASGILANRAADQKGAPAACQRDQLLIALARGERIAFAFFFFDNAIEVLPQRPEVAAGDLLAEGPNEAQQFRLSRSPQADDARQYRVELFQALSRQVMGGNNGTQVGNRFDRGLP